MNPCDAPRCGTCGIDRGETCPLPDRSECLQEDEDCPVEVLVPVSLSDWWAGVCGHIERCWRWYFVGMGMGVMLLLALKVNAAIVNGG